MTLPSGCTIFGHSLLGSSSLPLCQARKWGVHLSTQINVIAISKGAEHRMVYTAISTLNSKVALTAGSHFSPQDLNLAAGSLGRRITWPQDLTLAQSHFGRRVSLSQDLTFTKTCMVY